MQGPGHYRLWARPERKLKAMTREWRGDHGETRRGRRYDRNKRRDWMGRAGGTVEDCLAAPAAYSDHGAQNQGQSAAAGFLA